MHPYYVIRARSGGLMFLSGRDPHGLQPLADGAARPMRREADTVQPGLAGHAPPWRRLK